MTKQIIIRAVIIILFWSTAGTAFKLGLRLLPGEILLLGSSFFSWSLMGLSSLLSLKKRSSQSKTKKNLLLRIRPKMLFRGALLGFLNPFAYYLILFKAYELLPAQLALPLNFLWPIVLTLMDLLFSKKRTFHFQRHILAPFLAFIGVFFLAQKKAPQLQELSSFNEGDFSLGFCLALGSTIIWASYWLLNSNENENEEISDSEQMFCHFGFGTLYCFLYVFLKKALSGPLLSPEDFFTWYHMTKENEQLLFSLIMPLYIGFFEMGFTFILYLKTLTFAREKNIVGQFSLSLYLIPFFSMIFIHFVLGETLSPYSLIGLLFILLGVFLSSHGEKKAS